MQDQRPAALLPTSDRVVELLRSDYAGSRPVMVTGNRGSGRTTVLRDAVAQLALPPIWVDCHVFAGTRPLQSLRAAFGPGSLQLFPRPMADELADRLERAGEDPETIAAMMWTVITPGLSELTGRMVVLDDVERVDPLTRHVAVHVLQRLAQFTGTPVLLAMESAAWWSVDLPAIDLPTVEIEALTNDGVRALVEDLTGTPVPYRTAARLCRVTGGNLLAVTDAIRPLHTDQLTGRELLPHPLPISRAAALRLDAGESHRELLAGLALEERLDADQVVTLAGSPAAVDEAGGRGLLEPEQRWTLAATPAAALAAWALTPPVRRRELHAVLADSAQLPCASVHRAVLGDSDPVDVPALVRLLAEGWLGHVALGVEALPHPLPRASAELARALMMDGYLSTVGRLAERARGSVAGITEDDRSELRTQLAVLSGHVRDPLTDPPRTPPPDGDRRAWAATVLATSRGLMQRGDFDRALRLLTETEQPLADGPADLAAMARFVRAELGFQRQEDWSLGELPRAAREWLRLDPRPDPMSSTVMVFYLLAAGNPGLAAAVLNHTEPAPQAGALARAAHLVGRIQTAVVRGHFVAADDLLRQLDVTMPYSLGGAQTLGLAITTGAALGPRPERDRLEWRLDHPDVAGHSPHTRSEIAAASGLRHLVEGSYDKALALLDQAVRSRSALFTGATAVLASLLETSRALGATPAQNRALRDSLGSWWPDRYGERSAALEARCRALCAEPAELDAAFARALEACTVDFPVDLGRTRLAYGRSLQLVGRAADAARELEGAAAVFANERLAGWVDHVRRLQEAPVAAAPTTGSSSLLTPTERDIVRLVLRRRTNAEIARSLFMSKRSVELHLTRVFRKLGVARKTELIELEAVRELLQRQPAT